MGKPAIITGNEIDDTCSLSASSEDAGNVLEHLFDRLYAKVFMFGAAGAGWIQVDFGTVRTFDSLFIGNHNFAAGTTFVVKADNNNPPTTVRTAPVYRARNIWAALGTISARYLRLEHNDPGTPYIGELIPRTRTVLPRGDRFGRVPGKTRADIYHETQAGVNYVYGLSEREIRDLSWRILEAELATFTTIDDAVKGRLYPYVWIPDVAAAACYYMRNVAGDFRPRELDGKAAYDVQLQMQEEVTGTLLSG